MKSTDLVYVYTINDNSSHNRVRINFFRVVRLFFIAAVKLTINIAYLFSLILTGG